MTPEPQAAERRRHPAANNASSAPANRAATALAAIGEAAAAPTPLFRAGQRVPPGLYRQIEGSTRRQVRLTREDYLPASLDGRVAWYERVRAWGEVAAASHDPRRTGA